MSIRFAAPPSAFHARIKPRTGALAYPRASNDNGERAAPLETTLTAALRHFATHGLNAANDAAQAAQRAEASGDREQYMWWRDICHALDRRKADALDTCEAKATTSCAYAPDGTHHPSGG